MIYLYPETISQLNKKAKKVKTTFSTSSVTGSNSRYQNPERISAYHDMGNLEQFLIQVRPLQAPDDNQTIQIGHQVEVDLSGSKLTFHMCDPVDLKTLGNKYNSSDTRLISVDTDLGKNLLGKKVSDTVKFGKLEYKIAKIEVSELL